jgi:hypothetical protein
LQAHLTAFEEVSDGGDGLATVLAATAHGKNEIAEAIMRCVTDFIVMFFHGAVFFGG